MASLSLKLVVLDEAHKYMRDDNSDSLGGNLETIAAMMRHYNMRVVVRCLTGWSRIDCGRGRVERGKRRKVLFERALDLFGPVPLNLCGTHKVNVSLVIALFPLPSLLTVFTPHPGYRPPLVHVTIPLAILL